MPNTKPLSLRELTPEERRALEELAPSRIDQARLVERARILTAVAEGRGASAVARDLGVDRPTVYTWIHRFNEHGLAGLADRPRPGRPHTYSAEQRAEVIAAALTRRSWDCPSAAGRSTASGPTSTSTRASRSSGAASTSSSRPRA